MLLLLLLWPVVRGHVRKWVLRPFGRCRRRHAWRETVSYPGGVTHLSGRLLPCRRPCRRRRQPVDDRRLLPHGRRLPSLPVRLDVCGKSDRRRRRCLRPRGKWWPPLLLVLLTAVLRMVLLTAVLRMVLLTCFDFDLAFIDLALDDVEATH
jgi:hypothetical protein